MKIPPSTPVEITILDRLEKMIAESGVPKYADDSPATITVHKGWQSAVRKLRTELEAQPTATKEAMVDSNERLESLRRRADG